MTDPVQAAFEAEVTQEDLNTWYSLQAELERVKTAELVLRNKIFKYYFKNPKVGVNNHDLTQGWVLKGEYKLNYKVDIPLFTTLKAGFAEAGLPVDDLVKYKPEMSVTAYKALTEEQRRAFDQVLEIKPGTPALSIVLPKKTQ
jgi:hypothetical protein